MNQFGTSDQYLKICDQLSRDGYEARVYQSPDMAMYDLVQSLIHFMPHKNKIAVIHRGSHLIDIVTSLALKNQNQIITKKDNENTIAFLEALGNNVHFVYWVPEHEVTGEVFYSPQQCEEIRTVLNRKKIFSIQVTSQPIIKSQIYSPEIASYSVVMESPNIFKVNDESTVVYFSEKQKIPFGLAHTQEIIRPNSFIKGASAMLKLNDRLVINSPNALEVKQYLKLSSRQAFVANEYPSWVTDKWTTWWPEIKHPSVLQETLILSAEYMASCPDYLAQIKEAELKIKQLTSWKI